MRIHCEFETLPGAGRPARIEVLPAPAGRKAKARRRLGFTPHTILVVDDHQATRELFARSLRELGCEVVEAEGPLQAKWLALTRGRIDLLLTDFRMPNMNGVQLAHWFRVRFPRCKVVLTSAAPWEVEPYLRSPHDLVLMQKKDAFSRLAGIVQDLLDELAA